MAGPGLLDLLCVRVQTGAIGAGPLLRTTLDLARTRVIDELDPSVVGAPGVGWRAVHKESVDASLDALADLLSAAALHGRPLPQAQPALPERFPLFDPEPRDG